MKKHKETVGPTEPLKQLKKYAKKIINDRGYSCEFPGDIPVISKLMHDESVAPKLKFAAQVYFKAYFLLGDIHKSIEVKNAVYNAMLMMEAAEYAHIVELIPDIGRGQKTMNGAKEGHAITHGTQEQKEKRWGEYQNYVNKSQREKPYNKSYIQLCRWAGEYFKVHEKTIQKHTYNPIKK